MTAFHALAIDYDGTLTVGGPPSPATIDALTRVRRRGIRVILVTGRILDELRPEWPDADRLTDLVVAENGAVLAGDGRDDPLVPPVDPTFVAELRRRGVPHRCGRVLVATHADHLAAVHGVVEALALDVDVVANRAEVMIVPHGVTKASGLGAALARLGVSRHSTLAIGDAENDVPMLRACELGVAVGNAVDEVKAVADVVTSEPAGNGVRAVLDGPLGSGAARIHPRRWQLPIGHDPTGGIVTIPSTPVKVLVTGPSGSGKSYAAGMIAEQLIELGYGVLVLDPEGDYEELDALAEVETRGGCHPAVDDLDALLRQGRSVVVDLSLCPSGSAEAVVAEVLDRATASRRERGSPQWLLLDEAHRWIGPGGPGAVLAGHGQSGLVMVTYQPEALAPETTEDLDVEIRLDARPFGRGTVHRAGSSFTEPLTLAARRTHHIRHWHKYIAVPLPRHRGFWFRRDGDQLAGIVVCSLTEFHDAVGGIPADVLRHHARGHDFSRWIDDVYRDHELGASVRDAETALEAAASTRELASARHRLMDAVERRLLA